MSAHLDDPFPSSIVKGTSYEPVDPVLVDADVYGWALRVERHEALGADEREQLVELRNELAASMEAFPSDARPYFERLLQLADETLAVDAGSA